MNTLQLRPPRSCSARPCCLRSRKPRPATGRVARNRVERILDGCALREVYEQTDGLVGESFSLYDASRKVWHQAWGPPPEKCHLIRESGLWGWISEERPEPLLSTYD